MKGVVLEIHKKKVLVLQDNGTVIAVPNHNYAVGSVIDMKSASHVWLYRAAALAASVILLFTASVYAYFIPDAYVSLDVNPSIEFTLNRLSRVIHIRAADSQSEILAALLPLRHRTIDEALDQTIQQLDSLSVFSREEDNNLIVAVASRNQQRAEHILNQAVQTVSDSAEDAALILDIHPSLASLEYVQRARSMGTTPGKLRLIELLRQTSEDPDSIIDEDWIGEPVHSIMHHIHTHRSGPTEERPAQRGTDTPSPGPRLKPPGPGQYGPLNAEMNPGPGDSGESTHLYDPPNPGNGFSKPNGS